MISRDLNWGREIVFKFCSYLIKFNPQTILDIAAGGGTDLSTCKAVFSNPKLIAYDSYKPNINNLLELGFDAHLVNLELDIFPDSDNSIDLIIANQTLEHCKEIFWIFDQVSKKLKVGGHFLIGVPNLASAHNRLALLLGYQPTCIQSSGSHVRGFTKKDLENFLIRTSSDLYSVELFQGSNFYPFPPIIARFLSKLFPNFAVSIFFLLRKNKQYKSEFLEYPVINKLETNFWTGKLTK